MPRHGADPSYHTMFTIEARTYAVRDLVKYAHHPRTNLNQGRLLAIVFLGRAWSSRQDDEELVIVFGTTLKQQLEVWRAKTGTPTFPDDTEWYRQFDVDQQVRHPDVSLRSMVWVYGFEHIATADIASHYGLSQRRIQQHIGAGCTRIAAMISHPQAGVLRPRVITGWREHRRFRR